MNTPYVINLFNEDDQKVVATFIQNGYITENQLLRIAINTFQIKKDIPIKINQIQASKLILALSFVINSRIKERDPKSFDNYIKRLLKGGINEVKEIWTHRFLSTYFRNYNVILPLFSEGPDGFIENENENIPVEIKTRNPEVFEFLEQYFDQICESLEEFFQQDRNVICTIRFDKFNRSNNRALFEEKHDLPSVAQALNNIKIPISPEVFRAKRKSANVEMQIEITSFKNKPQFEFVMPNELLNDCLAYQANTSIFDGKFFGAMHLLLTGSEDIKRHLSKTIINKCLKASNIPRKGVVAIYFDTLTNEYMHKYFERIATEYVKRKPDLAILGVQDRFDLQKKQIIGKMLAIGENIKDIIVTSTTCNHDS